jgi:chromosome partitioning protein
MTSVVDTPAPCLVPELPARLGFNAISERLTDHFFDGAGSETPVTYEVTTATESPNADVSAPVAAAERPDLIPALLPGTQGAEGALIGPTGRAMPVFPAPLPLRSHGPARIIAMCNQKGGVGKTTTTINLGAALAECGRKVLLVDFDPQGALSVGLGVPTYELNVTIYNLLVERGHDVRDVVQHTRIENLDMIPANIDLAAAEVQLVGEVAREMVLGRVLRPLVDDYDVVLIDCQPSLGLLTVNALTASHGVIIPLECEFFAMRGVALLVETIEKICDRLNPRLQVDGILATMYDSRTLHSREVVRSVVDHFGDQVFHTVISRTVKFPDSSLAAEPITTYASTHPAAEAYRQLARELIARGGAA